MPISKVALFSGKPGQPVYCWYMVLPLQLPKCVHWPKHYTQEVTQFQAQCLPGHNTYPEEINKFTWRDWVEAVEKAYRELATCCDQVFLGGESTGGLLALYLAPQHPEISGLLTYAPALKLDISTLDQIKLRLAAPFIPYLPKSGEDDDLPWKGYTVNPLKGVIQLLKLQRQVLPKLDANSPSSVDHPGKTGYDCGYQRSPNDL